MLERLKALKIGDYIYALFILLSILGFYANKKEKNYLFNIDKNGKKKAHTTRIVILAVALLVYIYFLENRIQNKKNDETKAEKFLGNLDILSAILFLIGGIIALYTEYKGDEAAIITE